MRFRRRRIGLQSRTVRLRAEHDGEDRRFLTAAVGPSGDLALNGQDLGPGTAMVSSDGEYEWTTTIAAADVPRLVALLGGEPGSDVLDVLARYADDVQPRGSYRVEQVIRESGIPLRRHIWSG